MEKKNGLRFLNSLGLSTKDLVELIIKCMDIDNNLSAFVIEQAKFLLFTGQGKGNPTEEELAEACLAGIISIAMNMEGAIFAYDIFLNEGVEKYLEYVGKILYDEKVG